MRLLKSGYLGQVAVLLKTFIKQPLAKCCHSEKVKSALLWHADNQSPKVFGCSGTELRYKLNFIIYHSCYVKKLTAGECTSFLNHMRSEAHRRFGVFETTIFPSGKYMQYFFEISKITKFWLWKVDLITFS